jgi:hypothetical protein
VVFADCCGGFMQEIFTSILYVNMDFLKLSLGLLPVIAKFDFSSHALLISTQTLSMDQKALKIYIAIYGTEDHPSVAGSYGNLGITLGGQGDFKGAEKCFEKARKIKSACS